MSKTVNGLCCIVNPYAQCVICKGIVCDECDVWITEECPAGEEIGDKHYIRYLTPHGRLGGIRG